MLKSTDLLFLGAFLTVLTVRHVQCSTEDELYGNLTGNYGNKVRPIKISNQAITVTIGFTLIKLVEMNEPMQRLEIAGSVIVFWTDYKLTWTASDYLGLTHVTIPSTEVWVPDIGQSNSLIGTFDLAVAQDSYSLEVDNTGRVVWFPGGVFIAACEFDVTYFPFDQQVCEYTFQSWTQRSATLKLKAWADTARLTGYKENGQWELVSANTTVEEVQIFGNYELSQSKYEMKLRLVLNRRHTFYLVNMVAPCVLISFLVVMVFYLPPDAGEKISFGVTVLLAFSVFQLIVADTLPKSSRHTALISIYLLVLMVMTTFSIMMSVFVLNAHFMCTGERRLPTAMRKLVFGVFGRITCFMTDVRKLESENAIAPIGSEASLSTVANSTAMLKVCKEGEKLDLNLQCTREILHEIQKLTNKLREDKKTEQHSEEWKMAARIIDRFFLYVTLVVELIATLCCLVFLPLANY